ncbi:hypothetical protein MUK42_11885 [Musa troglodytarum]|uniref:Uncharacterized protein n=1 Tax=Musa troglodytarum TaxID=320322 RepID=A0A9E7IAV3_9LILI|nr:hypothetical protein MUK42_11885 [Musa troglodytarum]
MVPLRECSSGLAEFQNKRYDLNLILHICLVGIQGKDKTLTSKSGDLEGLVGVWDLVEFRGAYGSNTVTIHGSQFADDGKADAKDPNKAHREAGNSNNRLPKSEQEEDTPNHNEWRVRSEVQEPVESHKDISFTCREEEEKRVLWVENNSGGFLHELFPLNAKRNCLDLTHEFYFTPLFSFSVHLW